MSADMRSLERICSRMAKLNSIMEDLKSTECQVVYNVLSVIKARSLKRWKILNNQITDSVNEAKDNVKYLSTLDKVVCIV